MPKCILVLNIQFIHYVEPESAETQSTEPPPSLPTGKGKGRGKRKSKGKAPAGTVGKLVISDLRVV